MAVCRTRAERLSVSIAKNKAILFGDNVFEHAGRFNKCALKFGRWYDMIWMERILAKPAPQETSPFRPLPDIDQPYIDSILNRA